MSAGNKKRFVLYEFSSAEWRDRASFKRARSPVVLWIAYDSSAAVMVRRLPSESSLASPGSTLLRILIPAASLLEGSSSSMPVLERAPTPNHKNGSPRYDTSGPSSQ